MEPRRLAAIMPLYNEWRLPSEFLISSCLECQICSETQWAISGENLRQTSAVVSLLKRPKFFLIYSLMEATGICGLILWVDGSIERILDKAKSRSSSLRVQWAIICQDPIY